MVGPRTLRKRVDTKGKKQVLEISNIRMLISWNILAILLAIDCVTDNDMALVFFTFDASFGLVKFLATGHESILLCCWISAGRHRRRET